MIEIFIDKVTIFLRKDEEVGSANKKFIIKIKFGPKVQFIVKEGQLAANEQKDDIVDCDEDGNRKWSRTIRVGKSYLFPSFPDTVLMILSKFPLEIEVWDDDENEVQIFVGVGVVHWETQFYHMLKETADVCKLHEPLAVKQVATLTAECCCIRVGEVSLILRMSALGDSIITEFQQLLSNPDQFVFRTNKAPSMFQCYRVDGENPNFCMAGSLYETATLEDPDVINKANKKIEVCTEQQSCAVGPQGVERICEHINPDERPTKTYPIDKIRMGDITGPCGNTNCPLAHKVRAYIRNLEAYKTEVSGKVIGNKKEARMICGACDCKDDRYHRDKCPESTKDGKPPICKACGGIAQKGETCDDKVNRMYGTGLTPKGSQKDGLNPKGIHDKPKQSETSKTHLNYMIGIIRHPEVTQSLFGRNFIIENVRTRYDFQAGQNAGTSQNVNTCCCSKPKIPPPSPPERCSPTDSSSAPNMVSATSSRHYASVLSNNAPSRQFENVSSSRNMGYNNQIVYNADYKRQQQPQQQSVYNVCTDRPDDKDCKCNPPKPTPPCKTFDCECLTETANVDARKYHKPYCPSYKHKNNCPVTMMHEEEDKKMDEYEVDEAEPLPYGLPPIHLGPCPVLGRPCTVPDGFARMYKIAAMPTQPPSYSDAGKVCCSKEYERIKKAIKEYMKNEKGPDFRCINKFNVDTERRCCDKEQRLMSLMGKSCCGSHKMAIQEKYKQEKREK